MSFEYENWKCPVCEGEMISRQGQYGKFWGCMKFPECKGTRDANGRSKEDREKWKAEQSRKRNEEDFNIGEWKPEEGIRWKK